MPLLDKNYQSLIKFMRQNNLIRLQKSAAWKSPEKDLAQYLVSIYKIGGIV
jgi:hypothetical protein